MGDLPFWLDGLDDDEHPEDFEDVGEFDDLWEASEVVDDAADDDFMDWYSSGYEAGYDDAFDDIEQDEADDEPWWKFW